MGSWSPHLSLLERDMLMITERLAEIPEDGLGEEEKAVFTLAIQIPTTHRPIVVELLADAKVRGVPPSRGSRREAQRAPFGSPAEASRYDY